MLKFSQLVSGEAGLWTKVASSNVHPLKHYVATFPIYISTIRKHDELTVIRTNLFFFKAIFFLLIYLGDILLNYDIILLKIFEHFILTLCHLIMKIR